MAFWTGTNVYPQIAVTPTSATTGETRGRTIRAGYWPIPWAVR